MAAALFDRGIVYFESARPEQSVTWFGRAIASLEADAKKWPGSDPWLTNKLCYSHANRAVSLSRLGKYADALLDWDRVLELCNPQERLGVLEATT